MTAVRCDYCGLTPQGRAAAYYITTSEPTDDLTSSRFVCDRTEHLGQAVAVVGHGGRAVSVAPLGRETRRAER